MKHTCVCSNNRKRRTPLALGSEPTSGFKLSPSILLVDAMASQQLPTKAAPTQRKAPPQVPTVPTAGHPETGLHVAVQQFLAVVRAGRRGGWRAWEPLAAQIDMEDRTALMEFVAVMSMVPPVNMPTAGQVSEHMSTLFPTRATTATAQETTPTVAAPTIPAKAYPGAPPSTWVGQVQWQPPAPRSTAAGSDPTAVSGSAGACGRWSSAMAVTTSGTSAPSAMGTARRSAEGRCCQHGSRRRARRAPASSDGSNL